MSIAKAITQDIYETFQKLANIEKHSYRYWRIRILYSSIIGYAAYYLVRQNFSMAIPGLMDEFGYTKVEMGWIVTIFSIVYGIGKFFNGYLSDRSNARYFMSIGLFLSAIVSIFMGLGVGLSAMAFIWGINAWFQSMGWPPAARMLTHWFSPKELGTKWGLCASSHQIGAAVILVLAGYLIDVFGWRSAFIVPSILAFIFSIFLFNRLRDTPQEVGLPSVEEYKGDGVYTQSSERITIREVLTEVFGNKLVWYIGIANMCLYIPRIGVFTWAPTFLKEFKGVTLLVAGWQTAGFEMAGLLGGILAGWISDRLFAGRRGPVGALFLLGLSVCLFAIWLIPRGHPFLDTIALMVAGFLVYGPQVLAGVACADLTSKRAVGVAIGFTGSFAYAGSAISGVGIGAIVENYGWPAGFILFIVTSLIGAFFFSLTWNHRSKNLNSSEEKPEAGE